jgi:hypothetical protein
LISYTPTGTGSKTYKGPLRITSNDTITFISGDLYNGTVQPNPAEGSPILPRANYWAYVRSTSLNAGSNGGFSLGLEYWQFKGFARRLTTNETLWADDALDGGYTVDLAPKTAPSGFPDPQNYFEGDAKTSSGTIVGHFTMGWVSTYLRRITLEIGTVPGVTIPSSSTSGTRTWKSVFDDVGYDITILAGKTDIPEPSNPTGPGFFNNEQEHAAVLQSRSPTDFDKEWKYYLLGVRRIADVARGAMIDAGGEYNSIPREGTCIASDWLVGTYPNGTIDNTHAWPASVRGKQFHELHDPWFRTALHEVGHMFNLGHPTDFDWVDNLMQDTESYVDAGEQGKTTSRFPENVGEQSFRFGEGDRFLMMHRPDTFVRPGWVNFGSAAQWGVPPAVENLDVQG